MKKNIKIHIKNMKLYILYGDTVLVEALFGIQAIGTSVLSLFFVWDEITSILIILFILNGFFGIWQILFAFSNSYFHRHWTNWTIAMLSFCISISLFELDDQQVAIGGYAFLGFGSLHSAIVVNRLMHIKNKKQ